MSDKPEVCANCGETYMNHFDGHRFCNDGDKDMWHDPRWFPKKLADAIIESKEAAVEPSVGDKDE